MRTDIARVINKIRDAEKAPEAWPAALKSLTDALGVSGAGCVIANRKTGEAEWACLSGVSEGFESTYVDHYSKRDIYAPLLHIVGDWRAAKDCLPQPVLKQNDWYNEFMLKCGVADILGCRLVETSSHAVFFALHQPLGRYFGAETKPALDLLSNSLASSLRAQVERRIAPSRERYFFHIHGPQPARDELGVWFSSAERAVAFASAMARERAKTVGRLGQSISAVNERGEEIARVPVI